MKAFLQTFPAAVPAQKSWVAVYADLFKARLTLLVLLTTMVGFYLGLPASSNNEWVILHAVLGMALVAGGGAALNQLIEREHDARMRRTQDRPLPSGRMQPATVLWIGCVCAVAGILHLALTVNFLTSGLAAGTLALYVLAYTPLKRVTWLNTLVGAIPGAMPPLIGWTAARGEITTGGLVLFAIQVFWQIPHFLAIAWIYREDYAKAGFQMLPVLDPRGERTSLHALAHTGGLVLASIGAFTLGLAGSFYFALAILLGAGFLWFAVRFTRELTIPRARQLFYASIVYLPLLLIAMVLNKAGQ